MGQVRVNRPRVGPYVRSLAPSEQRKVRAGIRALSDDPRPGGDAIKVLETDPDGTRHFRIRIGIHRVVCSVEGRAVFVHIAFNLRDGYGWLERR